MRQSESAMSDRSQRRQASGPVLTAMCPLLCLTVQL